MKRYRVILSATCYRALSRRLRRAVRPEGYDLPPLPRLARGRLETLLDVVEGADRRQRAAWLSATERELGTLDAFLGYLDREDLGMPGSARALRRRVVWTLGLD